VYSDFEAFDLEDSLLDPAATFVGVDGSRYTHIGSQRGSENDWRGVGVPQVEFLVQHMEEILDGEVASSLQRHDGD
jgi:hypothetical protein